MEHLHDLIVPLQHVAEKYGYGSTFAVGTVLLLVGYKVLAWWWNTTPSDLTTLEDLCEGIKKVFENVNRLPGATLSSAQSDQFAIEFARWMVAQSEKYGYKPKLSKTIAQSVRRSVRSSLGENPPTDRKRIYFASYNLPAPLAGRFLHAMFRGDENFETVPGENKLILWQLDGRRFKQLSDRALAVTAARVIHDELKALGDAAAADYAKLFQQVAALARDGSPRGPVSRSSDRGGVAGPNGNRITANNEA